MVNIRVRQSASRRSDEILIGAQKRPSVLVLVRWPVGGIRTWCRYVYRDAAFNELDIDLFMPNYPEAEALQEDLSSTRIRVKLVNGVDTTARYSAAAMAQILRRRYSLVHSHGFTSAVAAAVPCAIRGFVHLVTTHDVILENQYQNFKGRLARGLVQRVMNSADCVQAVSAASAKNLQEAFPESFDDPKRLLVIPNGVEPSRFLEAKPQEIRTKLKISNDSILVGFFGRFMGQKGFRYLIEAVLAHEKNKGDQPSMVVLAVGEDGFRREEEEAVQELGLSKNFRFLGFSPNVADLMRSVDIVAMPSLWEACGLLAMEALIAGVPLVVSDCDSLVDICDATPAKVVPKGNSEALLKAICEQSTNEARGAAESYRFTAAKRFDVSRTSHEIVTLYHRLTSK